MAGSSPPDNTVPGSSGGTAPAGKRSDDLLHDAPDWLDAVDEPRSFARFDRPTVGILLLVGAWFIFLVGAWSGRHSARPPVIGPFTPQATPAADIVAVDIGGRVARPGLYRLPANARVKDALDRAGGALPGADLSKLNQAAWVEDGAKIIVPAAGSAGDSPVETPGVFGPSQPIAPERAENLKPVEAPDDVTAPSHQRKRGSRSGGGRSKGKSKRDASQLAGHPINLNQATDDELMQLPGVGPKMADKIMAYRQQAGRLNSVDDLRNVPGIGPKRMDALRPLVTVR